MAISISETVGLSKQEKYKVVSEQIIHMIEDESDQVANLSNVCALMKYTFDSYLWVGFYLADSRGGELVLGPFQGRPACTRIRFGKGVCGTSAENKSTVVVDNVDEFPGHIVCDSLSKSEIVVPIVKDGRTVAVIDVDSDIVSNFDDHDRAGLEQIASILRHLFD